MTQSADLKSSKSGARFFLLTPKMLSLILLTYPMQLILLLFAKQQPQSTHVDYGYIIFALALSQLDQLFLLVDGKVLSSYFC